MIDKVLRPKGHELSSALNGSAAIDQLQNSKFDLLITDLMMPEATGFEVLEWVKEHAPSLPVVVCSAYAKIENLRALMLEHPYRVILKPFRQQELAGAVTQLLRTRADDP
jgi:CheY-like chemotaxis protein